MEENDSNIEENLANSIDVSDEIKEPHVRQIISSLGGKKLSAEDINKFKQLEATFHKIASLENGENILNNLTGEIKEEIENGTTYQVNNGVVSIGQVATDVINRAEKVYEEQATVEQEAYEKVFNEKKEKINIKYNANSISKMTNETFAKYEEMEKQYQEFLKVIGIKKEDRDLQNLAYNDAIEKSKLDGPDGNLAKKVLEAKERLDRDKDAKALLEYQKSIIEHCKNEIKKLRQRQISERKGTLKNKKEFDVNGANKSFASLRVDFVGDIEKQIIEYTQMMASAQKIVDQIERGTIGEEVALLGAESSELQSFFEIDEQIQELKSQGINNGKIYKELMDRRKAIIEAQRVAVFERQLEELIKSKEKAIRILNDKTTTDYNREDIAKRIKDLDTQISHIEIKKEALIKKRDVAIEGGEQSSEIITASKYDFNDLKRNSKRHKAYDIKSAKVVNDSYLKRNGEISYAEIQKSYLGITSGNGTNLVSKDINKVVSTIIEDHVNTYKNIVNLIKTAVTQEQKDVLFQELVKSKGVLSRRLEEIGLDRDYRKNIVQQFFLPDDQIDPIDYQMALKRIGNAAIKQKVPDRADIIEKSDNQIKRLENGREVYKDILKTILGNESMEAIYPQLKEALNTVLTIGDNYKDFEKAESKEDVISVISAIYDSRMQQKDGFDDDVKSKFMSIVENVYDNHGKDGLQMIFENSLATNIYTNNFENYLMKEKIKRKYLYPLNENEKVSYDKTQGAWPDCFNMEESIDYLNVLIAMKRDLVREKDIMNSLLQLNPEAARNAYALYELGLNKTSIKNPDISDEEKDTLRQRNKELIEMFFKQYQKKCNKISRELMDRAEFVGEPERSNLKAKASEYTNMVYLAFNQIKDFDIESMEFEFPGMEQSAELISDQDFENGIASGILVEEEIETGDARTTEDSEMEKESETEKDAEPEKDSGDEKDSEAEKDSIVGTVSAETLRESQEGLESLPEQLIPSASVPSGTIITEMLKEEDSKSESISIDSIVKKTLVLGVNVIGKSYEETRDIASKKQGIDKGGVSQAQVSGKKTTPSGGQER